MPITVIILSQGNELLNGSILNTNVQYLGAELAKYDTRVLEHRCLPDDVDAIAQAYKESLAKAQIVISSGGLGPTMDDCTRQACTKAFSCTLSPHERSIQEIRAWYKKKNRPCSDAVLNMGHLPSIAVAITNPCGSAPSFYITQNKSTLFCFPGVPRELKELFIQEVIPILPPQTSPPLSIGCFGTGESGLMALIKDIPQPISYRSSRMGIRVTFYAQLNEAQKIAIKQNLSPYLYAWGHSSMPKAIGELLVQRGETISTAESCTSGAIAAQLTSIPGASRYFLEGVAVYSNEAKIRTCGVPRDMIEAYGAVSEPVAIALAQGMRTYAQSTWSLSVTGIAGPGGGSIEKPVGTVHIAVSGPTGTHHKKLQLTGNREQITQSTMGHVLFLLHQQLLHLL